MFFFNLISLNIKFHYNCTTLKELSMLMKIGHYLKFLGLKHIENSIASAIAQILYYHYIA
jgi:hypothetical protein